MISLVDRVYHSWTDALTLVSHGVVLLSSTREIDARDLARFLHLTVGYTYHRPHSVQTYMYGNGAFVLFKGVMSEPLFQSCKEHAAYVADCICRLEKIPPRTDAGNISDAVDLLFQHVTSQKGFIEERDAASGEFIQAGLRRREKRMRPWIVAGGPAPE